MNLFLKMGFFVHGMDSSTSMVFEIRSICSVSVQHLLLWLNHIVPLGFSNHIQGHICIDPNKFGHHCRTTVPLLDY